jgi:hypothetical protein
MPVKPAAGETLVEERRTRLESASDPQEKTGGRKHPPMWDFIDTLTPADWNTKDYEMTLYRGSKANRGPWCGKFFEPMTPDKIQEKFGGGGYVIYMKVPPGNQLRYFEEIEIVGAPKNDFISSTTGPTAMDATSQLIALFREEMRAMREEMKASRGGDMGIEAVRQAMQLNGQVFSSAVPAVTNAISGANGSGHRDPGPMDELTKTFMQAAIAKMLNPADPIEQFAKMATAMGTLGYKMGGANASGSVAAELARGLLNALPQLASHVGGIMDQYRRAEEAKLQQVALMRGAPGARVITQPAAPAAPAEPGPGTNVIEMPAAPATEANPAAAAGNLTSEQTIQAEQLFQFVETKVVELLLNTDLTPEEAANDALTFIDVTDKNLVDELLRHGEAGLRWAFSHREILQRVPLGPRLDTFIAEFIKNGRKVAMPIPAMPNPNIPPA